MFFIRSLRESWKRIFLVVWDALAIAVIIVAYLVAALRNTKGGTAALLAVAMEIYQDGVTKYDKSGTKFFEIEVHMEERCKRSEMVLKKTIQEPCERLNDLARAGREIWQKELALGKTRPDIDEDLVDMMWKRVTRRRRM